MGSCVVSADWTTSTIGSRAPVCLDGAIVYDSAVVAWEDDAVDEDAQCGEYEQPGGDGREEDSERAVVTDDLSEGSG